MARSGGRSGPLKRIGRDILRPGEDVAVAGVTSPNAVTNPLLNSKANHVGIYSRSDVTLDHAFSARAARAAGRATGAGSSKLSESSSAW